jgi:PST family polysaccharide transporter
MLARSLGPDLFGRLNFAVAFVMMFLPLASFGTDAIVIRELVRGEFTRSNILGSAFLLRTTTGASAVLLCNLAAFLFFAADHEIPIMVAILSATLLLQAFDVFDCYFQSRVSSRYTVLSKGGAFSLASLARIALVLSGAGIVAIATTYLFEAIFAVIVMCLVGTLQKAAVTAWRPAVAVTARIARSSWPLAVSSLSIMVYMRIDQIMIGTFAGHEQLGQYSVALRFSETLYFLPALIVSSLMPKILSAYGSSKAEYYELLQRLFNWVVLIAYCLSVTLSLCAGLLITTVFGDQYASAIPILIVHVWTAVFVYLGVAQNAWIIPNDRGRFAMVETIVAALSNVLLNLVLIPRYQALGAAVSTLTAQFLASYITWFWTRETRTIMMMMTRSLFLIWGRSR